VGSSEKAVDPKYFIFGEAAFLLSAILVRWTNQQVAR
jgi:hypothetical protein